MQWIISNFLAHNVEWASLHGPVTYYDPNVGYMKMQVHERSKHFDHAYQREVRIAFGLRQAYPALDQSRAAAPACY